MKKAIGIMSTVLYLLLSTGIYITIHYCHNHFSDFKVYGDYDESCCDTSCGFSHKCCSFDTISGKITQEHVSTDSDKNLTPKEIFFSFFSFEQDVEIEGQELIDIASVDTSPVEDIPILNCSLTFYG